MLNRQYWWEEKNNLEVHDNHLIIAKKSSIAIASEFGTPLFIYNINKTTQNYQKVKKTFSENAVKGIEPRVYYAIKANNSKDILEALKEENAYLDTTSINEVKLALDLGNKPEQIIFTGINFGLANFEFLANSGVLINVDSFSQIKRLAPFAPLDISIRFNPGIGIGFTKGLTMGGNQKGYLRLGIYRDRIIEAFREAKELGLNPIGLHQHIGSNWFGDQLGLFLETADMALKVAEELYETHGIQVELVDFGGGFGVRSVEQYPEFPLEEYCEQLWQRIKGCRVPLKTVAIEPGRYITGNAGILVTTVNMVEQKGGINFVGIDAGFNLFNHHFFFGIKSEIINCSSVFSDKTEEYTVGGYLCESSDIFAEGCKLPIIKEGDTLAIYPAGAYGASEMAKFHLRSLPKQISIV